MAAEHQLSHIAPALRHGWVTAVCGCGWRTPDYRNSGLAESLLDAHVLQERAREMWINASMILLRSRDERARSARERAMLADVMDRVRKASRADFGLDPIASDLLKVVAVDEERDRGRLTNALRRHGDFLLVGEGDSYVDAVALTVVERPRLVVIGDRTEMFDHRRDLDLIHDVSPDSRVCILSDGPLISDDADLVLDKSLPMQRVVAHLVLLAG